MRCNFISLDPFWFRPGKFSYLLMIVAFVVLWSALLMNFIIIQFARVSASKIHGDRRKMNSIKVTPIPVLAVRALPLLKSLHQQYNMSQDIKRKMNIVFHAVQDQFRLTTVSINSKVMLIQGVTPSAKVIGLFCQRLRQKLNCSVKVSKMSLIKGGCIAFSVSVQ